jgi:hypothetical protein
MPVFPGCSTSIQKQVSKIILFLAADIIFSILKFQIFTRILLLKLRTMALVFGLPSL